MDKKGVLTKLVTTHLIQALKYLQKQKEHKIA